MEFSRSSCQNDHVVWRKVQCKTITADVCATFMHSFPQNRKCVVLLHGWMGQRCDLHFLAHPFLKMGYCVVVPDLPYHGESGDEGVISCSSAARLISECIPGLLQHLHQKPLLVTLVGYSLGGRIAFEIAMQAQAGYINSIAIDRIVLISSATPPHDQSERNSCRQVSQKRCEKLLDASFSPQIYEQWLRNSWYAAELWGNLRKNPLFDQLVTDRVRAFSERGRFAWALAAKHMCRSSMTAASQPLLYPTLYIYGTCDTKYAAMATRLQNLCLDFRSVPIQGAGHNVLLDSPSSLLNQIETFLGRRSHLLAESAHLASVIFKKYTIPLTKMIMVGGHGVSEREGVIVGLVSSSGHLGVGDICPLPGLHLEDIDCCVKEIQDLAYQLHALPNLLRLSSNKNLIEFLDFVQSYSPVSRNGFESAFIQLLSRTLGQSYYTSIRSSASNFLDISDLKFSEFIDINGVLPRTVISSIPHEMAYPSLADHESIQMSHFKVVKLKVGACENIEEEIEIVKRAVAVAISTGKRLRLDANRAWTLSQYNEFETRLKEYVKWIEYIEEPLCSPEDLRAIITAEHETSSKIAVALDESLIDCSIEMIEEMASSELCRALVLKPAVIGSLRHLFRIVNMGNKHCCDIVFSTVFESGIGTAWTSILAGVLGSEGQHHGIGTFKHLRNDVVGPSFEEAVVQRDGRLRSTECEQFLVQAAKKMFDDKDALGE